MTFVSCFEIDTIPMQRLIATNDITDHADRVIVPKGTILERQEEVYTGKNRLTGTKIQMDASWADDEVFMEYLEEVTQ